MKQKKLANMVGIAPKYVGDIKAGRRSMSVKMALSFERATGIPREMWLFPDIYGSPWEALLKSDPETVKKRRGAVEEYRKVIGRFLKIWLMRSLRNRR